MTRLNNVAYPDNLFFDAIACMFRRVSVALILTVLHYACGYGNVMQQELWRSHRGVCRWVIPPPPTIWKCGILDSSKTFIKILGYG